jgi:hypothetical protein
MTADILQSNGTPVGALGIYLRRRPEKILSSGIYW